MNQTVKKPATVRVELGARSYDILVGPGLLAQAGTHLRPLLEEERVFIVTDETVAGLYLDGLTATLNEGGIETTPIVFPAGEQTKDLAHLEFLTDRLLDAHVERRSMLLALGGGVIGDLTGFAASLTLRGIDFVQMPTTLLAQVDSAIGGKTGINTPKGKNLLGSFYQPRLVLSDTATLTTLPRRELLAGYAEVVKYGLIRDAKFFAWLEANGPEALEGKPNALTQAIVKACETKAAIVAADEREAGARALLNLGHTFGHALEAANDFDHTLHHGEAVAIGMCLAFELSVRLGLCPASDAERVRNHLAGIGLPTTLAQAGRGKWEVPALLHHMRQDKKVRQGRVRFVLARRIGETFLAEDIATEDVEHFLEEAA